MLKAESGMMVAGKGVSDTQRYLITFDSNVSKEARAKVMQQLEEIDVMYTVGTNNTHSDAMHGKVPQVDRIMVLWDGFGEFPNSPIYAQLPTGCTVSRA